MQYHSLIFIFKYPCITISFMSLPFPWTLPFLALCLCLAFTIMESFLFLESFLSLHHVSVFNFLSWSLSFALHHNNSTQLNGSSNQPYTKHVCNHTMHLNTTCIPSISILFANITTISGIPSHQQYM